MLVVRHYSDVRVSTYSAAVCELSDACDMLLVRGLEEPIVDCDLAIFAKVEAM